MTGDRETHAIPVTRRARAHHWLGRWWRYLKADASSDIAAWQLTLLGRRKFTHPAEVVKMRQPVRANPRATWFR